MRTARLPSLVLALLAGLSLGLAQPHSHRAQATPLMGAESAAQDAVEENGPPNVAAQLLTLADLPPGYTLAETFVTVHSPTLVEHAVVYQYEPAPGAAALTALAPGPWH